MLSQPPLHRKAQEQCITIMLFSESERADNRSSWLTGYRLCVFASGSVITDVLNCLTLIIISCLHFGQYKGKFSRTVLSRTLIRVLLLQSGHNTHFSFSNVPPPHYGTKLIVLFIPFDIGSYFISVFRYT